jgi:hypothetical protein
MTAAVLGAPLALGLRPAQLPEPGGVSEGLLVERPETARSDEGLVIEARRGERPADKVRRAHRVEVERRRRVHVLDPHPLADRLRAGADTRRAVDRDEAVRALAGAAEETAAAVVLERAREGALPARVERRPDRVALEAGHLTAVERERDLGVTVDALTALLGKAGRPPRAGAHPATPLPSEPVAAAPAASGVQARFP